MGHQPARIQVTSPATLLAVIPHLLGFHPHDSLVVLALAGPHARIITIVRFDLPDPPDPDMTTAIADHAAGLLRAPRTPPPPSPSGTARAPWALR